MTSLVQVIVMKIFLSGLAHLMMKLHSLNCLSLLVKLKPLKTTGNVEATSKAAGHIDTMPQTTSPIEATSKTTRHVIERPKVSNTNLVENVSATAENSLATVSS